MHSEFFLHLVIFLDSYGEFGRKGAEIDFWIDFFNLFFWVIFQLWFGLVVWNSRGTPK